MELRHLRYFVAVAEDENMRHAAGRLHIVQPALSRQIRQLEDEIGYALFDRLPRGVRLNAAGQVFLELAREILSRADEALERTRRVARGEVGRLCIGFIENASWFGAFPAALQQYRARYPKVSLDLRPMFSIDQFEAITAGQLDAGFCYTLEALPAGCETLPLRMDAVVLAVPRRYGWKKRRDVCLHELQDEAFVGLARTPRLGLCRANQSNCVRWRTITSYRAGSRQRSDAAQSGLGWDWSRLLQFGERKTQATVCGFRACG